MAFSAGPSKRFPMGSLGHVVLIQQALFVSQFSSGFGIREFGVFSHPPLGAHHEGDMVLQKLAI